jgi:1-acyl-sn-glycerol-3-phosphate acyltransferase
MHMDPSPFITAVVCHLRRLEFDVVDNIPSEGPALIAASHSSPMDLFYYLALMNKVGRHDHRFLAAAELLDEGQFRLYARAAIGAAVPSLAPYVGFVANLLSFLVPPLLRGLDPIPVYRTGDDSEARRQSVECLLNGQLVTIAPGWGNNSHRDSNGLRPLTYSVASIARQYFDATSKPLAVIPVAITAGSQRMLSKVCLRIGKPFHSMSDEQYPELFSKSGQADDTVKYEAYQHFTHMLAVRLSELT